MPPHMVIRTCSLSGYGLIKRGWVSLPRIPALIDGTKYLEPGDVRPPEDDSEARRQRTARSATPGPNRHQGSRRDWETLEHIFGKP